MNIDELPNLCNKAICVTNNIILGAIISSYFHDHDYFGLVEQPRIARHDWTNDVIRINNLFASARINKIILADVEEIAETEFRKSFRNENVIVIKKSDEIKAKLLQIADPVFRGALKCTEEELPYGLLLAKINELELIADNSAESILIRLSRELADRKHCVVVENHANIASIIASNYAYSLESDFSLIEPVPNDKIREIYDQVHMMSARSNVQKREFAEKEIASKTEIFKREIDLNKKEFVTYFTMGTPFGYFLNNIPSTHLLANLQVGAHIIQSINFCNNTENTRLALILDPGFFPESECKIVASNLKEKGIYVKEVNGNEATSFNIKNFISFYPYDFLYICSHAGEHREGAELTADFSTRDHKMHRLKFQIAHTFSPTDEGIGNDRKIEVFSYIAPLELDGVNWDDEIGKDEINAGNTISYFYQLDPSKWKIVERKEIDCIRNFTVIKSIDGDCPIATHHAAGSPLTCPIIFNNTCNSIYGFCEWFLAAGIRSYIGTLTSINDSDARLAAEIFFSSINEQTPLPITLWKSQLKAYQKPIHRTYIHFGCHFVKILASQYDTTYYPKFAITKEIEMWTKKIAGVAQERDKDDLLRIIKFLNSNLDK